MFKILIVEDNTDELDALKKIISGIQTNTIIDTAKTYEEACQFIQSNHYSFYFLDIQLETSNSTKTGIDLAHLIRSNPNTSPSPIIFITTVTCDIQEAVNDLHCYAYINKPYLKEDIEKCFKSLIDISYYKPSYVTYRDISGVYLQIITDDIIHVTANRHLISITCTNVTYQVRQTSLDKILKELGPSFIMCHKSHIINKRYIKNIDITTQKITLDNIVVPIGRAYKDLFIDWS